MNLSAKDYIVIVVIGIPHAEFLDETIKVWCYYCSFRCVKRDHIFCMLTSDPDTDISSSKIRVGIMPIEDYKEMVPLFNVILMIGMINLSPRRHLKDFEL